MSVPDPSRPDGRSGRQKTTLIVLGVVALATVFLLPGFVNEPWLGGNKETEPQVVPPSPSNVSPSTAAEKTRYRQESQTVLANIIAVRDRLQDQNVEAWAAVEFGQAMRLIETGDEQYSYGEYAKSLETYRESLNQFVALEQLGNEKLAGALADGLAAIESLNQVIAGKSVELALIMSPDDPQVQALAARVEKLPALSLQLESGDQARAARQYARAEDAYLEAVKIDPLHKRAAESLATIKTDIVDSRFRRHMSRGYSALENNDFDNARAAFGDANKVYPGHDAVVQALAQVENQDSQMLVSQRMRQAAEMESREEWQQALSIYESLLEQDPTLTEARARLVPAGVRRDLDVRLVAIIDDPLKLAEPSQFRRAQAALGDASGISKPGPRLSEQIASLKQLMKLAVTPVNVVFQSDNQTHVVLFRIKDLGQFGQTSLILKPGRYIAAGTRSGYRDVRVEFTITGEPQSEPIVVRCEETI